MLGKGRSALGKQVFWPKARRLQALQPLYLKAKEETRDIYDIA